jgi:hypothetical protein
MTSNAPKIFGWNEVDDDNFYYILEGPFDAMFIENSIAMIGSSIPLKDLSLKENNAIFVFDNEPRNFQITNKIRQKIEEGYMVTLFPKDFNYKDINEAILDGWTIPELQTLLRKNSFKGLEAELRFSNWRRC